MSMGCFFKNLGWWLLLLAAIPFLILWDLDSRPLQEFHEGRHASIALEMLDGGEPATAAELRSRSGGTSLGGQLDRDWLSPTLNGEPWLEAPPLNNWLIATLLATLPAEWSDMWAIRLPNALFGILAAVVLGWWVRRATGRWLHGTLAGLCFASMKPVFFHGFRTGDLDGYFCFGVIASLAAWASLTELRQDNEKPRRMVAFWFGLSLALGLMGMGPAAFMVLPIAAAHWATARVRVPRGGEILVLLLTLLVVAGPWHIWMAAEHGAPFWESYFALEAVNRVLGLGESTEVHTLGAFELAARVWIPLGALLPAGLLWMLRDAARPVRPDAAALAQNGSEGLDTPEPAQPLLPHREQSFAILMVLWLVIGTTLAATADKFMYRYLLPMLAPAMVAATGMLIRARPGQGEWLAGVGWLAAAWCLGAQIPLATESLTDAVDRMLGGPLWAWQPMVTGAFAVLAVALAWRIGLWIISDRRTLGTIALRAAAVVLLLAQAGVWFRQVERPHPPSRIFPLAQALADVERPADASLVVHTTEPLSADRPAGYWHLRRTGARVQELELKDRSGLASGALLLTGPRHPLPGQGRADDASAEPRRIEAWLQLRSAGAYALWQKQ